MLVCRHGLPPGPYFSHAQQRLECHRKAELTSMDPDDGPSLARTAISPLQLFLAFLRLGLEHYQRVSCFRLAIHLRRRRLTLDETIAALKDWAGKNRPRDGKRIITDEEIVSQAAGAYRQVYPGCGCENPAVAPFCDPRCPIARRARGPE
jgi:hypothetical protein